MDGSNTSHHIEGIFRSSSGFVSQQFQLELPRVIRALFSTTPFRTASGESGLCFKTPI